MAVTCSYLVSLVHVLSTFKSFKKKRIALELGKQSSFINKKILKLIVFNLKKEKNIQQ